MKLTWELQVVRPSPRASADNIDVCTGDEVLRSFVPVNGGGMKGDRLGAEKVVAGGEARGQVNVSPSIVIEKMVDGAPLSGVF
jgi:hypothetical protein